MAALSLLLRVRTLPHLARRRVSTLRPTVRSMAAAATAPSDAFRKIQIQRDGTVSLPPPFLFFFKKLPSSSICRVRSPAREPHFRLGACEENSNEICNFLLIFMYKSADI